MQWKVEFGHPKIIFKKSFVNSKSKIQKNIGKLILFLNKIIQAKKIEKIIKLEN